MNLIRMNSESLQRVIILYDLPNVLIRVCGKHFFINQSILSFNLPQLNDYLTQSYSIVNLDEFKNNRNENIPQNDNVSLQNFFFAIHNSP
jgi:hypothetical protein